MLKLAMAVPYTYTIRDAKSAISDATKLLDVEDIGDSEDYGFFQLLLQEFLLSCAGECLGYYRDNPVCVSPELADRVRRRVAQYAQEECPYELLMNDRERVYQFVTDIVIDLVASVYGGCHREYRHESADMVYGRTLILLETALASYFRLSL